MPCSFTGNTSVPDDLRVALILRPFSETLGNTRHQHGSFLRSMEMVGWSADPCCASASPLRKTTGEFVWIRGRFWRTRSGFLMIGFGSPITSKCWNEYSRQASERHMTRSRNGLTRPAPTARRRRAPLVLRRCARQAGCGRQARPFSQRPIRAVCCKYDRGLVVSEDTRNIRSLRLPAVERRVQSQQVVGRWPGDLAELDFDGVGKVRIVVLPTQRFDAGDVRRDGLALDGRGEAPGVLPLLPRCLVHAPARAACGRLGPRPLIQLGCYVQRRRTPSAASDHPRLLVSNPVDRIPRRE